MADDHDDSSDYDAENLPDQEILKDSSADEYFPDEEAIARDSSDRACRPRLYRLQHEPFGRDGSSYWNFLNSWSEISRGGLDHHNFMPPVFDSSFFGSSYYFPIKIPFSLDEIDGRANKLTPPSPLEKRKVFHFSKTKIGELKARTNAEAADGSSTNRNTISSLQSVLAHVWRSAIRNRESNPADLLFAVDISSRITPPLPEQYLGNAIDAGLVTLTVNDMIRRDWLGYAALQINKAVVSLTREKARRNLDSWIQNPKLLGSGGVPNNALFVAGSPRFDVYGNDFSWGKPIAVRSSPLNQFEGLMIVFPGVEEGSMDIEICGRVFGGYGK